MHEKSLSVKNTQESCSISVYVKFIFFKIPVQQTRTINTKCHPTHSEYSVAKSDTLFTCLSFFINMTKSHIKSTLKIEINNLIWRFGIALNRLNKIYK